MKAFLLTLSIAFATCISITGVFAQSSPCSSSSGFATAVVQQSSQNGCTTYTLEVTSNGTAQYGLSHLSIDVPCGQIFNMSNTKGWAMVLGTDPSTGITGIKVDDIKKFGETSTPQTFSITYTVCGASCPSTFPVVVAYKASNCIHYDTLTPVVSTLSVSLASSHLSCANSADGAVDLTVTGGTAPYSFVWSNGATTEDISGLTAGAYSVTVTDAAGATVQASTQVHAPAICQATATITDATCSNDGSISLSVTGGSLPYTYLWNTGATTSSITGPAGSYSVTIQDANGCNVTENYTIGSQSAQLNLTASNTSPTCPNGTDGQIDLTVNGGSGDYSFTWSNGSTTEDLNSIAAGVYHVAVVDNVTGCTASKTFILYGQPSVFVSEVQTIQPDCMGNLGSITVQAYFGTAPYTFTWNNGATGSSINGLSPGSYEVTVTDANGCTSSKMFNITAPVNPTVTVSGGNCSSKLQAAVSGGTPPYTYSWSTGATTSEITVSQSGTYTVTVTDAKGCTSTDTVVAQDPSSALNLTYQAQAPTCSGDTDGSIDLTIQGTATSIVWSNGATTEDITGLAPGVYTVTVSNGTCTATANIIVPAASSPFIMAVSSSNINCQGDPGNITVTTAFGTAPYTYVWNDGTLGATLTTANAGSYTVTSTDANGCTSQRSFNISQDQAPQVQIAASSGCSGGNQLTATAVGGTGPYTFIWSDGQTGQTISAGLGQIDVVVTDASGCTATASTTVTQGSSAIDIQVAAVPVSCAGDSDGSASVTVTGGMAPYTYSWSNGESGASVQDLATGIYSVTVTDAAGCSSTKSFIITAPDALVIEGVYENSAGCGQSTGKIYAQVSGGVTPYIYSWSNGESTPIISGLAAGNYTLEVEDANGCVKTQLFVIGSSSQGVRPTAMLGNCSDTVVCADDPTVEIPVYFTGAAPFTFSYTDGQSVSTVTTSDNPYMLQVSPQITANYRLTAMSNTCGAGTVSGTVNVQVSKCDKSDICTDPCFSTEILSEQVNGNCKTVTLLINSAGRCRYALSHFNIAVGCGSVTSASNSMGWPMELNTVDPTTGIYGLKVDEIKKFGETSKAQSFKVTYTVCSNDTYCQENFSSGCGPVVAYKAGPCVYYDKASHVQQNSNAAITADFDMFPNPYASGEALNILVNNLTDEGTAVLTVRNSTGVQVYRDEFKVSTDNNRINFSLPQLSPSIYMVTIHVNDQVMTKRLSIN